MRKARNGKAIVMSVAMLLGTVVPGLALTAPAQASSSKVMDDCTRLSFPYNGEGAGRMTGTYNLKVAPYASCGNVARLTTGTVVYYQCFYNNSYGNTWWYVRVQGTQTYGWMSWDNLEDDFDLGNDQVKDDTLDYINCEFP